MRELLQLSKLCYQRLFETTRDGILILDANLGKIVVANPFLESLLCYFDSELVGKQLWKVEAFKHLVSSKKSFVKLVNQVHVRYEDLLLQTKDGKSINVEFIGDVCVVGAQKMFQFTIHDITDQKRAQIEIEIRTKKLESLAKSQEDTKRAMLNVMEDLEETKMLIELEKAKDEAMLASIGEGLIAVDNNRKVITVNKIAEDMLGWKASEILGKEITNLPLANKEGKILSLDKRPTTIALSSGKTVREVYFFIKRDKTKFPMAITVTPIKLGGKTIGLIEIVRDITHELEIDQAKSEFVSLASHQLRTPVGIIKWYLEALKNEEYINRAPQTIKKYFDEIYRSNERIISLIRDLLYISRIEEKHVKDNPKMINLKRVIKEIVEQMRVVARKKRIKLHLIVRDNIFFVKIDVLKFCEVIENLVGNAIEYSPEGKNVDIVVSRLSDSYVIKIKDSGIGICLTDQKKIFTKFFRSKKAIEYNPEGTGLGLYVAKSYIEGWGGKIVVKSIEGKGSIFTVKLPINRIKGGDDNR